MIVVHLPPQHVTEMAFPDGERRHSVVVPSRAAAHSRVAFRIDPRALPVAFKLPAVLELLANSTLMVPASAARRQEPAGCFNVVALFRYLFNPPALAEPGTAETAIELPFRLVLSPEEEAGFEHMSSPIRGAGSTRVELWHSLLRPAPDRGGQRQVRAIWLRQGNGPAWDPGKPEWTNLDKGDHEPFPCNIMSQRDRADIVHVSGNRRYGLQTGTAYQPEPIAIRRLALTALGAWLDSHGDWSPPLRHTSLVEWTHRAAQGRDDFVRIVRLGFLYPFGHLAAKLEGGVSERKFVDGDPPPGDPPLLLKREIVVVLQPGKSFLPGAAPSGQAHTMPLHEVRLRTLVTPDLEPGGDGCLICEKATSKPFPFMLTGTDVEGNTVDLTTPLVWISATEAWSSTTIKKARTAYGAPPLAAGGANIAFAPGPNGDTTYSTKSVSFTALPQDPMPTPSGPPSDHQPGFWPELSIAEVSAPALQIIAGMSGSAEFEYHDTYKANGLGGTNVNEVIAQLRCPGKLALDFSDKGDRAGGLIQPNMSVAGLSRRLGPVGGEVGKIAELAAGKFDPNAFFAGVPRLPKLFGVFELQQVLGIIEGTRPSDVPRMVTERINNQLVARQVWNPVLVCYPTEFPIFVVDQATKMEIVATFDARSSIPKSDVRSTLTDFRIHLLGKPTFLKIGFDKVTFAMSTGSKPNVEVKMREVVFAGPLSFVERLKDLIPLDGFSDPPAIDVTPAGVRSNYSLALPDVAVGVFALQNLGFAAGFAIPFVNGALTVNFAFCKREEPFLLTVSLFGGGGFFNLAIDPQGVQQLEAAIEFGASCAVNLGVAQGGVHVMAGIYFKIESEQGCTLTGYLRLGGNMSVLGLISVSVELNLSFTYKEPGKAYGRAVLTVEIDIFLFSQSVQIECERQFAGNANDPAFAELMPPGPWHEYCEAFACA
ncbi:hypothetical protein U2F26_33530 [Micromonospora sp. 4G57]|uniref:Uncharacterized protein n=1 Tax=Micromonospora sicca TaxID=2202420 RepID=A0ABU5JNX0_9ACTN|nr:MULTISPECIES: hypothetical protein [unclassified Micromonospora]MDZ5447571.1 hypothetical protein [Micromonospora sp. 4G57]MDZ5494349.1 hypothetical protein [Micromonospora sp. 4G53]